VGFEIVRATRADRPAVVATIVAAFVADPAFRYFFPDDATYPAHAALFAGHLFDRRVDLGTVWLAEDGGIVSLWEPPVPKDSVGTVGPALDLPPATRDRLARYDDAVHRLLPPQPYWYLGILATRPDLAGRRLGRRLLAAGVTTAHADGVPALLETVSPSNVELYRREGWEVVARSDGTGHPMDAPDTGPGAGDPHGPHHADPGTGDAHSAPHAGRIPTVWVLANQPAAARSEHR
jgi:GNAT superfamily N-acetyltransferase